MHETYNNEIDLRKKRFYDVFFITLYIYIYIYIYIYLGSISLLMYISLNNIDMFCLHIFAYVLFQLQY